MSSIHETAYPRFKPQITRRELADIYTPSEEEHVFARRHGRSAAGRLALLVHIKTAQRLGYFAKLIEVPPGIIAHIATCIGIQPIASSRLRELDQSSIRQRLLEQARRFLGIKPITGKTAHLIEVAAQKAAETKQELADIINVVLEELIRQRYELPGFSTLVRVARHARSQANNRYFRSLVDALSPALKQELDSLLAAPSGDASTGWLKLKREPKKPTNPEVRAYLEHVQWLKAWVQRLPAINHIPVPKFHQYVLEARALDAADMKATRPVKRYALMVLLIHAQLHRALDDAVEILLRKLRKLHAIGAEQLALYHVEHRKRAEELIATLRDVLLAFREASTDAERGGRIAAAIQGESDRLLAECDEHLAYASDNYFPFMMASYHNQRPLLLNCLSLLELASTTSDQVLVQAIGFVLKHRHSHKERLPIAGEGINLQWMPEKWRRVVAPENGTDEIAHVHRKYFELCVLTEVMRELQSGDLYVEHSDQYSDYREQLIDWDTYQAQVADYGAMLDLPTEPAAFVAKLKQRLADTAAGVDHGFPDNEHVDFVGDELVIRKHAKTAKPAALDRIDQQISARLPPKNILDILVESERWLDLHRLFGPLSGFEAKIDDPRLRFITTLFCYGCNLGPTQTARSVKDLSRKQVAWLNLHHMTEERLEKAIVRVINAYNRFLLPKYWGSGKHASADGTQWNLYEQNLLAERHIRYGGYGGIGYYHVSDMYIALFSHFIPCGVYEAIYILDGLIKNESDIQPDTVHGDTQAQSTPVFGLAYLLGIKLMPRIRNLKKLVFFRPDRSCHYQHIDALFTDNIDWQLIETHLPDMLRIALSIKAGKITPSTLLRRLGTASRKNKLYFAFRELGRVVRTLFLLEYVGDVELRKMIHAATNKSEEFNHFVQWLFFGGDGIIAENVRHEQRKVVKYNQLVANLVILHNVEAMTRVLKDLQSEGIAIDSEILAALAPYRTEHINRFGDYMLNLDRDVPPMRYEIQFL
jgi:TnpA family transposase